LKVNKRYWDSSCFLAWLKKEPDKIDDCRGIIQACETGQVQLITSAFTLAEVLYLKRSPRIPMAESKKIRAFFEHRYIITISLDRDIAERAQDLIWEHNLKSGDAIHAASALYSRVKILDTFDPDFLRLDQKIGNPPMQVGKPHLPYQFEIDVKENKEK
jgi:predicted nucleic acid-binding protein